MHIKDNEIVVLIDKCNFIVTKHVKDHDHFLRTRTVEATHLLFPKLI